MNLIRNVLPEAEEDIESHGDYIFERNPSAALRFADAVNETIKMLLRNPNLGERLSTDSSGQIRFRTISGFKNYLIFYRRVDTVLEIIRVLHGARDYEDLFE